MSYCYCIYVPIIIIIIVIICLLIISILLSKQIHFFFSKFIPFSSFLLRIADLLIPLLDSF
jgi:hypothetical protein